MSIHWTAYDIELRKKDLKIWEDSNAYRYFNRNAEEITFEEYSKLYLTNEYALISEDVFYEPRGEGEEYQTVWIVTEWKGRALAGDFNDDGTLMDGSMLFSSQIYAGKLDSIGKWTMSIEDAMEVHDCLIDLYNGKNSNPKIIKELTDHVEYMLSQMEGVTEKSYTKGWQKKLKHLQELT